MVKIKRHREMVKWEIDTYKISENRACEVLVGNRFSLRRISTRDKQEYLRKWICELAGAEYAMNIAVSMYCCVEKDGRSTISEYINYIRRKGCILSERADTRRKMAQEYRKRRKLAPRTNA